MKCIVKALFILLLVSNTTTSYAGEYEDIPNVTIKDGILYLIPLNSNSIRVRVAKADAVLLEDLIYTENVSKPNYQIKDNKKELVLQLERISVVFDKMTEVLTFKDSQGKVILQEAVSGRFIKDSMVQGEHTYKVEQRFISPEDECLYGTGQFQDGYLNIRGLSRRLTQVNTQISIPFILSNKGYGLLWNNYGLTEFNPTDNQVKLIRSAEEGETITVNATSTSGNKKEERNLNSFTGYIDIPSSGYYSLLLDVGQRMARKHYLSIDEKNIINMNNIWLPPTTSVIVELAAGKHEIRVDGDRNDNPSLFWRKVTNETTFSSPVAQSLDYTVFAGTGDEVISSYRELTGPAPLMPLWSLGYIHCRERYNTQSELLENAREFRKRGIPIDMIVQDWQYWGKYGWNSMKFDEDKYPDPAKMVRELHAMNMKLMISVWSKVDTKSELGKQISKKDYYIGDSDWIDFFNPEAAAFYWENFSTGLLRPYQIDAWWQDATEPENDDLQNRKINNGKIPGEVYRNVYPMYVNKTIYEGLRKDAPEKRAMILTRSGFSGMQRYAAATWSGDVGNDWETLRRQIVGGLGQMASGLPWWTYDIGGFFRPENQYVDKEYQERFLRWFQAATFFPLMRVHGYMSQTELWRYGKEVEDITSQYLNLRYRMLPYIYSQSAAVSFTGSTLMRPLVMDFPEDQEALNQQCEFMFGPSFLVAPITSKGVESWKVYLPAHKTGWFDFWNGQKVEGGQTIETNVDISKIPLYVKSGSIIPFGPEKQYASEKTDKPYEIRIYPGADAIFTVYEDEGNNYNYEKGKFSTFNLLWNDTDRIFEISKREGSFQGMEDSRIFNILVVGSSSEKKDISKSSMTITYDGEPIKVKMPF